jgi:hypothetical protein
MEEDVDMTGFVPLKKTMVTAFPKSSNELALEQSRVQPNEERLARIYDLLQDSREVVADEVRGHSCSHGLVLPYEGIRSPQYIPRIGNLVSKPGAASTQSIAPPTEINSSLNQNPAIMVPPFVRSQALLQRASGHNNMALHLHIKEDIDDGATASEDDPVQLAIHAVDSLSSDAADEMEEDEVLH